MNRLFDFSIKSITMFLVVFFVILVASLLWQFSDVIFRSGMNTESILFSVKLSFYTASVSAFIGILICIPVAYYLSNYRLKYTNLINTMLDLPVVLSPIALGAIVLVFFNTGLGRYFEQNITNVIFTVKGIILAQFLVIIGLGIRLMKHVFESIDPELSNIARTLGANKFETFCKVILPVSKNGIISTFLLMWGRAISEFGATITIAGATPFKTESIPVAINLAFESGNLENAIVLILILILISLSTIFITRKILGSEKSL